MLPEATAVMKTRHTCCGWVHAAGGSWGTWKRKTQPFLNYSIEIKKLYSSYSLASPCLCGAPSPIALSVARDDNRFPPCVGCSIPWAMLGFSGGRSGPVCHTQLVFSCGFCVRTIPHTHLVGCIGGWGVGGLIPAWGWNNQTTALSQLCKLSTIYEEKEP